MTTDTDPQAAQQTPPPAAPAGKTFTQDELDRIVSERLDRERKKFVDYEDLKAKASKFDELDAASKSELERERSARENAEARAQGLEASTKAAIIRAAARAAGAVDPDVVAALIDPAKVTIGDDGQVTGHEEAIKELLDAKPFLVGKPTPPPGGADGGARPGPPALDPSSLTMEEYVAARRDGRIS